MADENLPSLTMGLRRRLGLKSFLFMGDTFVLSSSPRSLRAVGRIAVVLEVTQGCRRTTGDHLPSGTVVPGNVDLVCVLVWSVGGHSTDLASASTLGHGCGRSDLDQCKLARLHLGGAQ